MTVNPWNAQPEPDVGDASADITFLAVGRALSDWENFEFQFSSIFVACVNATGPGRTAAQRAYGSIVSFSARREMVTTAVKTFLAARHDAAIETDFAKLNNEAKEYGARRNEIAHGIVQPFVGRSDEKTLPDKTWGWALFPPYYNSNKNDLLSLGDDTEVFSPRYAYSSVEIGVIASGFRDIAPRAAQIGIRIQHVTGSIPAGIATLFLPPPK